MTSVLVAAGEPAPRQVDDADLGVAQHAPRHRGQDRRDEERQRDQHLEHAAARRVGARHDPGQQQGQRQRRARSSPARAPTVLSSTTQVLARWRCDVAVEVELAGHAGRRRVQAAVEQHRHRIERQEAEDRGSARRCRRAGHSATGRRTTHCVRPRGRQRSPSSRLLPPKARTCAPRAMRWLSGAAFVARYSAASGSRFLFSKPSGLFAVCSFSA